jgi:hypothetical protein
MGVSPQRADVLGMAATMAEAADALRAHVYGAEYGFWEYVVDPETAAEDLDAWVDGTAPALAEEPPAGDADTYGFVTLLVACDHGGEADHVLRWQLEQVPDEAVTSRETFRTLLSELARMSYRSVASVTVLVRPGPYGVGVAAAMLDEAHYEHVVPLTG